MNTSRSLDFPVWMPSALVKELRQGLRTPSFILLVSIVPSLLSFFFLFSFIINPLDGEPFVSPDGCQIIFWVTMVVALLFIMPLRASTSIRNELLTRNNELLLLTRQSAGRIVLGKWISFMAQSLLIAFISLPFFLIRYYYGEINLVQDVTLFFLLYLGSGMLTAYTLWASAMPSLMRIIAFSLMGIGILTLGGNHAELNFFRDGAGEGVLLIFLVLADAFLVISSLLLLAREWFSPAAQNTAAPLRKLLLAFFAASILPLPFLENASGSIQNIITGNSIFVMVYGIFLMIINLNTPARLLPIHMEQMKNKRFSRLQQLLFLPGMPGSVLHPVALRPGGYRRVSDRPHGIRPRIPVPSTALLPRSRRLVRHHHAGHASETVLGKTEKQYPADVHHDLPHPLPGAKRAVGRESVRPPSPRRVFI